MSDQQPPPFQKGQHRFDFDPDTGWTSQDPEEPVPDGWATMTVDLNHDPSELTSPESFVEDPPPPRPVQVIDGGWDELLVMLSAADRLRARLMRRDLRWINQIAQAAGYRIALVRKAREDD